jgi:hypothetical protein
MSEVGGDRRSVPFNSIFGCDSGAAATSVVSAGTSAELVAELSVICGESF